ncbi:hypothetical protein GO013_11265 [Pseudodesulfovibrio sp. JC047]|uniref:phage tail protein n=1 Tax=Pseudodesulfovibrio sp. JC047 TaxID=2683199 RepID=UPI0013CFCD1B|nr:phage tail protein [Pseudodesulfovibrio sp. JC047]NDV20001.1 hypothetical protein [Pseudodesulfovibrio sp. JC047]
MAKGKSIEIKGVPKLLKAIEGIEKGSRTIIRDAVNRTADGARTDSVRLIRQHLMLKAKSVRDNIRVVKGTKDRPVARLIAKGKKGLPLLGNYPVRPGRLGTRKPKEGVSVQIKKHGTRKILKGSFLAKMKSGHVGVFKREKGAKRLPVKQLFGVGFIGLMERGMIHRKLKKSINSRLEKILRQGINRLYHKNLQKVERLRG